ncbi:MAG TPA: DUF6798 domain-containing protein [Methylomirabilota bacterium]|nr:DUF6798 domain-containing protein [Methylomirabilota bacterium]
MPPAGFDDGARWVKTHTPPGEPVLVSPHMIFAEYWLQRPVVVQFKFVPHGGRAREWYERLVDLSGAYGPDEELSRLGGGASALHVAAGGGLPGARYQVWGAIPGPDRALVDLSFVVAYQSGEWAVYDLGGP